MPFSVTGTGLTDLVMLRIGVLSAAIVSEIVIGVMPPPVIVAVFTISEPVANGANSFTAVS